MESFTTTGHTTPLSHLNFRRSYASRGHFGVIFARDNVMNCYSNRTQEVLNDVFRSLIYMLKRCKGVGSMTGTPLEGNHAISHSSPWLFRTFGPIPSDKSRESSMMHLILSNLTVISLSVDQLLFWFVFGDDLARPAYWADCSPITSLRVLVIDYQSLSWKLPLDFFIILDSYNWHPATTSCWCSPSTACPTHYICVNPPSFTDFPWLILTVVLQCENVK